MASKLWLPQWYSNEKQNWRPGHATQLKTNDNCHQKGKQENNVFIPICLPHGWEAKKVHPSTPSAAIPSLRGCCTPVLLSIFPALYFETSTSRKLVKIKTWRWCTAFLEAQYKKNNIYRAKQGKEDRKHCLKMFSKNSFDVTNVKSIREAGSRK